MNDNGFLLWLEITSNLAQLASYDILIHDFNNNDLMEYLKHQDRLLEVIIEQNQQIIDLLRGGTDARD